MHAFLHIVMPRVIRDLRNPQFRDDDDKSEHLCERCRSENTFINKTASETCLQIQTDAEKFYCSLALLYR